MDVTDIPLMLIPLLEERPWLRKNKKGEDEKYEDNRWSVIANNEVGRVTKLEAQIWLAIYNMFMTQASN